jgi:hypothetical protein
LLALVGGHGFVSFMKGKIMKKTLPSENDLPAGLSQPALRALAGAGYFQLDQLSRVTEQDLKQLHGIGPRAMELLRRALQEKGLSFAGERK